MNFIIVTRMRNHKLSVNWNRFLLYKYYKFKIIYAFKLYGFSA